MNEDCFDINVLPQHQNAPDVSPRDEWFSSGHSVRGFALRMTLRSGSASQEKFRWPGAPTSVVCSAKGHISPPFLPYICGHSHSIIADNIIIKRWKLTSLRFILWFYLDCRKYTFLTRSYVNRRNSLEGLALTSTEGFIRLHFDYT